MSNLETRFNARWQEMSNGDTCSIGKLAYTLGLSSRNILDAAIRNNELSPKIIVGIPSQITKQDALNFVENNKSVQRVFLSLTAKS